MRTLFLDVLRWQFSAGIELVDYAPTTAAVVEIVSERFVDGTAGAGRGWWRWSRRRLRKVCKVGIFVGIVFQFSNVVYILSWIVVTLAKLTFFKLLLLLTSRRRGEWPIIFTIRDAKTTTTTMAKALSHWVWNNKEWYWSFVHLLHSLCTNNNSANEIIHGHKSRAAKHDVEYYRVELWMMVCGQQKRNNNKLYFY